MNKIDLGDPLMAFAHPHSFTKHSKLERRRRQVFDLQPSPLSTDTAIPAAGCIFPSHSVSNFQSVPCIHPFCSSSPRSSFWLSLPQFSPCLVICPLHRVPTFCRSFPEGSTQSNGVFMIKIITLAGPYKKDEEPFGSFPQKEFFRPPCLLPLFYSICLIRIPLEKTSPQISRK